MATPVERLDLPLEAAPLAYWVGYEDPRNHPDLYASAVDDLARAVSARLDADRSANASGVVLDTTGWVDGDGFQALLTAASAFSVDAVLVLGGVGIAGRKAGPGRIFRLLRLARIERVFHDS